MRSDEQQTKQSRKTNFYASATWCTLPENFLVYGPLDLSAMQWFEIATSAFAAEAAQKRLLAMTNARPSAFNL